MTDDERTYVRPGDHLVYLPRGYGAATMRDLVGRVRLVCYVSLSMAEVATLGRPVTRHAVVPVADLHRIEGWPRD